MKINKIKLFDHLFIDFRLFNHFFEYFCVCDSVYDVFFINLGVK